MNEGRRSTCQTDDSIGGGDVVRLEVKFVDGSVEWFTVGEMGETPYVIKNVGGALMMTFGDQNDCLVSIPLASVRVVTLA